MWEEIRMQDLDFQEEMPVRVRGWGEDRLSWDEVPREHRGINEAGLVGRRCVSRESEELRLVSYKESSGTKGPMDIRSSSLTRHFKALLVVMDSESLLMTDIEDSRLISLYGLVKPSGNLPVQGAKFQHPGKDLPFLDQSNSEPLKIESVCYQ